MTTWHWVRHGPTHEKSFVGWRDVPADLSDTALIARVRKHLPDKALVVSSDLVRSTATADALLQDSHTRLPHERDLREIDFGVWDGMEFKAVAKLEPDNGAGQWRCGPAGCRAPRATHHRRCTFRRDPHTSAARAPDLCL